MKGIKFKSASFLTSALKGEELPRLNLPEIAIVGRSNVGKSSLINHLLNAKGLAKVSSTPGKTQRINYFIVDEALLLVDLPGYGYAAASKQIQKNWGLWIDTYLKNRELKGLLFLLDSRRELTREDAQFLRWASYENLSLLLVLTKADKLSQKEKHGALKRIQEEKTLSEFPMVLYSIKRGACRNFLIDAINKMLWGY
uniref:Probable GTP-binding protein EngB n=1 Tax=Candidatus Fritschea bemisiae TaxID=206681 RepID=Q7X395_9BACT|nr:probable GTP-binding protein [Candidatus Fritschea bemisiae]